MQRNFILIILIVYGTSFACAEGQLKAPQFYEYMERFCLDRPYDCMDSKVLTGHVLNGFYYEYYLQVEKYFMLLGYERAEFEFCLSSGCLEEGVTVKNSRFSITPVFPRKGDFFVAFGGLNQNMGVHFSKELTEDESDTWCSLEIRQGNELSRKAQKAVEKGEKSIWSLKERFYKKFTLMKVKYMDRLDAPFNETESADFECWLRNKGKILVFERKGMAL